MDANTFVVIFLVALVIVFRFIIPAMRRSDPGSFVSGQYSLAGGAVCPRCSFPYSRKTFSPNLLVGKLERCPHCGKIAVVRRASPVNLDAAEARLAGQSQEDAPQPEESQADSLRRQLDESRFED